jgi:hypothetical protein
MKQIVSLASVAALLLVPIAAMAQASQQSTQKSESLALAGSSDRVPVVQSNGKYYVDMESLARLTHGSISFQGSLIVLTPPQAAAQPAPAQAPEKPRLSEGFLRAEIEALTAIREWRITMVNAIQNNVPLSDGWVGGLRRAAESKVQLAAAATATEPDRSAAELLRNEDTNMQQMSDQFLALHTKDSYIPPDSFDNNPQDQKVLACARALASMAATKQYEDEPSCR